MLIKSIAALMLLSRLAAAEEEASPTVTLARTCVEVTEGGILDDAGRIAARQRLTRALEERDVFVVETECAETYRVEHSMVGRVMVVRISSPRGTRRWTNPDAEKLLPIYRAMVESLLTGSSADPYDPEVPNARAPIAPTPPARVATGAPPAPFAVTSYPAPDFAVPKSGHWYGAVGGGGFVGSNPGVSLAVGYRLHRPRMIIDARGRLIGGDAGGNVAAGVGVYAIDKREDTTLYAGGGLEISNTAYLSDSSTGSQITGAGVAPFGTAGVQLGSEDSTFRPFIQAELALPFYVARDARTGESHYPASFSISFGFSR